VIVVFYSYKNIGVDVTALINFQRKFCGKIGWTF